MFKRQQQQKQKCQRNLHRQSININLLRFEFFLYNIIHTRYILVVSNYKKEKHEKQQEEIK